MDLASIVHGGSGPTAEANAIAVRTASLRSPMPLRRLRYRNMRCWPMSLMGPFASILADPCDVRFAPLTTVWRTCRGCPKGAFSCHMRRSKLQRYSITSSAVARGWSMPSWVKRTSGNVS